MTPTRVTAFAPGSVANVAIGFDILGFSVDSVGDRVTLTRTAKPGVTISSITGVVQDLPLAADKNTAGQALLALIKARSLPFGFDMRIEKGIPLASGLGGSAASAVAAVVAANAMIEDPLTRIELLKVAMEGEAVASGSRHADNISPSLFGGLVLTVGIDEPRVKQIPVPEQIHAVIIHPHLQVSTKQARAILSRTVNMSDFVWQTANLAGFISGCYTNDLDLIKASLEDVIIEKQRQVLIPGFAAVRAAALASGALGCSISGAGPTVFALCLETEARKVRRAMQDAFDAEGVESDQWIVPVQSGGAHVVSSE
jgi:homoserine kinase